MRRGSLPLTQDTYSLLYHILQKTAIPRRKKLFARAVSFLNYMPKAAETCPQIWGLAFSVNILYNRRKPKGSTLSKKGT